MVDANAVARVTTGDYSAEYRDTNTGELTTSISHTRKNRDRSMFRLDTIKTLPDPIIPAQNVQVGMGVYVVIDRPPVGFDNTEVQQLIQLLVGTVIDPDNLDKFLTFQS